MEPIPQELIDQMPDAIEGTRESCQGAADATLKVLFLMGQQLDPPQEFPPIISNGVELWQMPLPWTSAITNPISTMTDLNGNSQEGGYLEHCRRNALEFNEALDTRDLPLAQKIAGTGPVDSNHVWNQLNSLAHSFEKEKVYRPLLLSAETKEAFAGLHQNRRFI